MAMLIGSGALLLLSLFMLLGFVRSGAELGAPETIVALLITVVLPAAGGAALAAGHFRKHGRLAERKEHLRQQTLEAETLRLAARRGGRLTVVEVVTEIAITPEAATQVLNSLHTRELAEIEITESGVLVYAFHDVRHLREKHQARGLLDA